MDTTTRVELPEVTPAVSDEQILSWIKHIADNQEQHQNILDCWSWAVDVVLEANRRGLKYCH